MKTVTLSASAADNTPQHPGMPRGLRGTLLEAARQRFDDPLGPGIKNKYRLKVVKTETRGPTEDGFEFEHCYVVEVSR